MSIHVDPHQAASSALAHILASPIAVPADASAQALRAAIEAEIELLITALDIIDGDFDLEDGADDEHGGDVEPSLGTPDKMINQQHAYAQDQAWLGVDLEDDRADEECDGRALPLLTIELAEMQAESRRLAEVIARLSQKAVS